ncbi:MAG: gamma-glutamyltransferase [Candidatus Brocadiae bacterium]|nr:gamma-glutamyltransferase [Candidatus Brocadiia bacterium]
MKTILLLCMVWHFLAYTQGQTTISYPDIFVPVQSKRGMVSSQESRATEAGLQVLREGGNAVDAAVTIGFALAVTLPRAGNIGGGGFMVAYLAKNKEFTAIDYREKAPKAATRDMFLDKHGNADPEKSCHSYWAIGVPGTVAGLVYALEKYGTISLKRALQPAIALASEGIVMDADLSNSLRITKPRFASCRASMKVFFKENGEDYEAGEIWKQPDLAWTLQKIAMQGKEAFYQGEIAQKLIADIQKHGGLITAEDLQSYQPAIRKPVQGTYRGYNIYSMPPPSSGGVHIIQMLNILEKFPLGEWGHNSAKTIHVLAESMRLAYADRSYYLGDPDFIKVPVSGLTSKEYADKLRSKIQMNQANLSSQIKEGNAIFYETNDTTHYSVVDQYGNAVSNTYTLNHNYGCKIVAEGTGILLNNEMDDFVAKPGTPNSFGLIGGEANAIHPEKRMLSSMTPTIVTKDGKIFLVTGSPGGSTIITCTLQIILNVIDHRMNIASATNASRIHHQWFPDELRLEVGISPDTISLLREWGHTVSTKDSMGSTQSIMLTPQGLSGASDPRRPGAMTAGH